MFSLSDLRSIQVNQEYVCMEEKVEDSFNSYKLLDDLLSRSENLEEFDVNVTTLVTDGPGRDEGVPDEVLLGHGQHIAETLQQVRQSCNLNICYGLTRKPVCWRHLFEQDVIVEDRNDYRKQTYNFFSQVKRKRLEWEELKKAEEEEQKMTKEWYKWEKGEEGGTVSRISQTGPCDPRTCLHPLPHFDERQTRLVRAPPAPFGRGLENLPFGISSPSPLEIPVYGSSLIPLVTSPTILGSERNQPFESFISPYSDGDVKAPPMELFALPDFCGSVNPSASTGSSVFSDWMDSGPNEEFDKRLHSHPAGRVNSPMAIFLSPTEFSEGIDPPTNAGSSPAFLDWTDSELSKVNLIDGCKIFGHQVGEVQESVEGVL